MPMAVTNRVKVGIVKESTPGTTPASPRFRALRLLTTGLADNPQTIRSEELISDRMTADLIAVGKQVGGDLTFEWSCRSFDDLIEAALFGTWTRTAEKRNDQGVTGITAVASTTYTVTSTTPAWAQNDIVRATGFANAANNKVFVAGAASSATSIVHTGGVSETPGTTARLKKVGFVAAAAGDVQAVVSPARLTSTTTNFTNHGLAVGQWVKVGGSGTNYRFATAANNGYCRISAITSTSLTFDIVPTGWAADTATGVTVAIFTGDYIRNGTTQSAWTVEQQYTDIGLYEYFTGLVADSLRLEAQPQQILRGSCSFIGMNSTAPSGSRFASAADEASPVTDVLNTSSNVGRIAENGAAVGDPNYVLGMMLEVRNNLRAQPAIGTLGAVGVGSGRFEVAGELRTYFGTAAMLAKVLNAQASSFDAVFKAADGTGVLVDVPRLKFTTGSKPVSGSDQDIVVTTGFTGLKHPTLGYALHLQNFEGIDGI